MIATHDAPGLHARDRLYAVLLGAGYFALLLATTDIGFPRDEGFYFTAGEQYSYWFDQLFDDPSSAFTKKAVDKHFAYNPEHPALPKILYGLSWRLFGTMRDAGADPGVRAWYQRGGPPDPILGLVRESTAMRLPAMFIASVLVGMLFLFGTQFFNRRVGLASALILATMPHFFWHAHLACFDVPVAAMWFLSAYAFFRAERGGWGWAVLTAVALGLAVSTKLNAYFLGPTFVVYVICSRALGVRVPVGEGRTGLGVMALLRITVAILVIVPLVHYALWPKLWFEPIEHLKWYFARHAKHEYYWAYFFGTLYTRPPFPMSFPFVMSAMTLPAPTVLLVVAGILRATWEVVTRVGGRWCERLWNEGATRPVREPGLMLFVFLNFLIPFLIIAHPQTPIFGGTKHWMQGWPFLALFAGLAFDAVLDAIHKVGQWFPRMGARRVQGVLTAAAVAGFALPLAWDTLHQHANGSTYYNALAGGFGAMGEHAMQREFWGNTAFGALPYLNENAPQGATIDFHDTAWDSVTMYYRDGLLRPDLRALWDFQRADYFLFHWHKEFLGLEADVRRIMQGAVPVHVVAADGVPLLNVFQRPGRGPVGERP